MGLIRGKGSSCSASSSWVRKRLVAPWNTASQGTGKELEENWKGTDPFQKPLKHPLMKEDIEGLAHNLKILGFRGIFSKDLLQGKEIVVRIEGFLDGSGMHWTALQGNYPTVEYLGSFSLLQPDVIEKMGWEDG